MTGKSVPMEARLQVAFLSAVASEGSVTEKCVALGISRDSYYRYLRRFHERGVEGLLDDSSRPRVSPSATPEAMVELILATRQELADAGWDSGARSIAARLRRAGTVGVPDPRTIHRVLRRHGMIKPQPAKRPRSSYRRFEHPRPNSCWQLDGKQWALADESKVCLLRITDDHSRYIIGTAVARTENSHDAWELFSRCAAQHGPPAMLLTDNSLAFNARRITGGMGAFEAQVRSLGSQPVAASAHHPQTCGKKERDWQPLARWLTARPPAETIEDLQRLLDAYDLLFNTERPHQGLDPDQTPHERYTATAKDAPGPDPIPDPVLTLHPTVMPNGHLALGRDAITSIGRTWTGVTLTVIRDDLDVVVLHEHTILARIRIDPTRRYQDRSTWRPLVSERS